MARSYYTLLTLENGRWCPQFGDYDRAVVVQERRDSYSEYRWQIVKTDGTQAAINDVVATVNFNSKLWL